MSDRILKRKLNFKDALFLVIGSAFGSGIFLTTGLMASDCPSPVHILFAWLCGGAITIMGAVSFAELGTMFPGSGGPYVYLRESYGRLSAFLYGWGFFWIVGCGGIAALAAGLAESLRPFFPFLNSGRALVRIGAGSISWSLTSPRLLAALAIIVLSGFNFLGVKSGARFQNVLVLVRLAGLAVFIGAGLIAGLSASSGSGLSAGRIFKSGPVSFSGFAAALLAVLWTYDGWYSVTCMAEEISHPRRTLPAALVLGTLVLTGLYLLTNIVYIMALPMGEMNGVVNIGEGAALRLFGPRAATAFAAMIAVAVLGCLSASILFCARVPFAMARDGLFWKSLGRVNARTLVPSRALGWQMVAACILGLTGGYRRLYEFVVFALTIFFAATALALMVLRRRKPDHPRPYRAWGYPALPLLYAFVNLAIFVLSAVTHPLQAAAAAGVLALGIPAYVLWTRHPSRRGASAAVPGEKA
jgi:APA family basic amino acid/polyamine antiporter